MKPGPLKTKGCGMRRAEKPRTDGPVSRGVCALYSSILKRAQIHTLSAQPPQPHFLKTLVRGAAKLPERRSRHIQEFKYNYICLAQFESGQNCSAGTEMISDRVLLCRSPISRGHRNENANRV